MESKLLEIRKEIDKNDIVSFDIFDTLLLRNIYKPTELFKILANKVKQCEGIEDFFEIRVNGEKDARKTAENQEANYDEIYQEIQKKCSFSVDWIKQYELDLEYDFITVNPFIKKVYDYAKENNKQIFFISDMYLPVNFIARLLKKCGYNPDNLFISHKYRENKGTKRLYNIVQVKYNLDKTRWIHFGDNKVSDYEKALEYGIHAYWYKNVSSYKEWGDNLSIGEAIIAGIQNNFLYNGCDVDYWTKFGMKYASTVYYGFAKWLYILTRKEDNMYFFARDGWAIKKVYDMFCKADNNTIFTDYLYCSRKVLQLPAMASRECMTKAVKEMTNLAGFQDYVPTLRDVLEVAQISDWKTATEMAPAFGFASLDSPVEAEKHSMAAKMVARLSENMRGNLLSGKEKCIAYLEQECVPKWEHVNIMDIGWKGSCQEALEEILQKKTIGYYFGTVDNIESDKYCNMFGWYFDCGVPHENKKKVFDYIMMWEMMFSAPHGSVIGYQRKKNGEICPIMNDDTKYNEIINQFQSAAIFLCEQYMRYDTYMDVISPSFCTEQFQMFLEKKLEEDLLMFRNMNNDFMIGSTKMYPYVATIMEEDLNSLNMESARRKINYAFWKDAFCFDIPNLSVNKKSILECRLSVTEQEHQEYVEFNLRYAKIYFDFGKGFNENDAVIVPMKKNGNHYSFILKKEFHVRKLRIDPIEYHEIEVRNCIVRINDRVCSMSIPKQKIISHKGYKKIKTKDPYFMVEPLVESVKMIEFEADIRICD